MADNKTSWVFDLDIKDASEKIRNFQGQVSSIGKEENVRGLIDGLTKVGTTVGLVGAAFFALKTTMDMVFEGENIKAINQQFEFLAKNSGIAGDAMKESLTKAADGLIDDTKLLEIASQAFVKMGDNASRLPEIMELAKKSTQVFGGELSSNFEGLTNAISNMNVRQLKAYGIVIDSEKAMKAYAKSIGTTVDQLSESGKQQAFMNAALAKGESAFKGFTGEIKKNQNEFQRMKVILSEIKESFVIIFEKTVGPIISKVFGEMSKWLKIIKDEVVALNSDWGENTEATKAQINSLNRELEKKQKYLTQINETLKESKDPGVIAMNEILKKQTQEQIVAIEAEINGLNSKKKSLEETTEAQKKAADEARLSGGAGSSKVDTELSKKHQDEFMKSLEQMNLARVEMEEKNATDIDTVNYLHAEKREIIDKEFEARKAELHSSGKYNSIELAAFDEQLNLQKNTRLAELDDELEKKRTAALDRYAERNKETAKGFIGGWQSATQQAINDNKNMAKVGEFAFNTLKTRAAAAFKAMGDGSKTGAEAMKGFIFGALSDIATMKGEVMLAEGIGTFNPIQIAEGGALIALGGLIGSMAGSSGAAASAGGSSGGGVGASSSVGGPDVSKPEVPAQKKAVSIQVMGNYFETEQTKTKLVEMIRDASDATDFKFTQIGKS